MNNCNSSNADDTMTVTSDFSSEVPSIGNRKVLQHEIVVLGANITVMT